MRVVGLLVFFVFGVSAHAVSELSPSGHMRARYVYDEKAQTDSVTSHQAVFGLTFRSGEKFSSQLEMLHADNWGGGDSRTTPVYSQNHQNSGLKMHQAYATWMPYDDILFKVGRQTVSFGEGKVLSDNVFKNDPYSFDSFKFTYDSDVAVVDFWGIKYADLDSSMGLGDDPERNIYVLNVSFKSLPTILSKTDVHLIQDVAQSMNTTKNAAPDPTPSKNIFRYGLQLGGSWEKLFYHVFYAAESGDEGSRDVATSMADVSLGGEFLQFYNMKLTLGYHVDSGEADADFTTGSRQRYDSYFYDSHKFAGLMDVLGWGNLSYYYLQVEAESSEKTAIGLGYYNFSKTNEVDWNYVRGALTDTGSTAALGAEVDLYVVHSVSEAFSVSGHVGYFTTNNTNISSDPMMQVLMQADWKF